MINEPEHIAEDGTTRKSHYGAGKQPWDFIVEAGWGPEFAAGNVLKYIRRAPNKNGADDVKKARWYYAELLKWVALGRGSVDLNAHPARLAFHKLMEMLTYEERQLLIGDDV
jgi:hypothetical protein